MPRVARASLESRGWDVHDVHEEGLGSALDRPIQTACERENRIRVTLDTDFADTRRYNPARSPGVIVLRPRDQSIRAIVDCLEGAVRALATERIHSTLWIVEPERLVASNGLTGFVMGAAG